MCKNVNRKSLGRSLLAVAAAVEYLLKIERWSAAAFSAKITAALAFVAGDKKKSSGTSTATKKVAALVAALVAPLCPSLTVLHKSTFS